MIPLLHEDNHVIVVAKPSGMLSQGDLGGDLDVLTVVKDLLRVRDAKPGNVYLGLVHRLDRPVSGVMVLAKTSKAAGRLSAQFRERTTRKIYLAVVEGLPGQDDGELKHLLLKDRERRVTRVVRAGVDGAREAVLRYRLIEGGADRSLVEVELVTGLPHQIRVQLSAIGHPVVGDVKYGAAPLVRGWIALHASSIDFEHPVRRERLTVKSRVPDHWPW